MSKRVKWGAAVVLAVATALGGATFYVAKKRAAPAWEVIAKVGGDKALAGAAGAPPAAPGVPLIRPLGAGAKASPEAPGAAPASSVTVRDSKEYAERIAEAPIFRAFADKTSLDADKQKTISHIVALYYMDEASLTNTVLDLDKLARMRRQLRQHMDTRARAALPQTAWEAFEASGLLPVLDANGKGPT